MMTPGGSQFLTADVGEINCRSKWQGNSEQAGVDPNKAAGIPDARNFQLKLMNYQIVILSKAHFNAIVYAGPEHKEKRLYLYHLDKHFNVITSITGFLSRSYHCTHCETGYQNRWNHTCENVCKE